MPRYFDFKPAPNGCGFILYHSDGANYAPSRVVAEQTLRCSVHNWAAENVKEAEKQMELLTRLLRTA